LLFVICALADERVDQLMANYDKPGSPGCQVGVIRDGEFVHKRAYGAANLGILDSADYEIDYLYRFDVEAVHRYEYPAVGAGRQVVVG